MHEASEGVRLIHAWLGRRLVEKSVWLDMAPALEWTVPKRTEEIIPTIFCVLAGLSCDCGRFFFQFRRGDVRMFIIERTARDGGNRTVDRL